MAAPSKTTRTRRGGAAEEPEKPTGRTRTRGRDVVEQKGSRAVTDWEKELERQAEVAVGMEKNAAMGRSFSFKGGQMSFDGAPVKGNEVIVIVAASCIEKAFYDGRYDPDNPEPPVCFAFDTDPDAIAPIPDDVADLQCETCEACPHNVFGSADTGRGKACKDVRRLALIPAGNFMKGQDVELVEDAEALKKAEFGFAKLPPTSLNAYAAFVRQIAGTMKRPPHGVYAIMTCVPDPKNQFMITWEVIDVVPSKLLPVIMQRHDEALKAIQLPYTYPSDEEKAERQKQRKPGRGKAAAGGRQPRRTEPAAKTTSRGRAAPAAGGARTRKY